jgi:phosphoribosyl 1,2-cyclic phosphate phosphodiesterase
MIRGDSQSGQALEGEVGFIAKRIVAPSYARTMGKNRPLPFAWTAPRVVTCPRFMSDFSLTFLGTGTSQGVPMLRCDCPVCQSPDPRDKRSRASVYIETPECCFLVDSGPDFRHQALREKIDRIDAVVFTHAHTDHIMGFDDLRAYCHGGKQLPVYGSPETLGLVQKAFSFAFDGKNLFPGYLNPIVHEVEGPFKLGSTQLVPLPVPHGRTTTFGYLFIRDGRKLAAYLSDCKVLPPPVIEELQGVETLIVDALRHKEHPTHMNITEALLAAEAVRPQRTFFTHLCHDLAHASTEATLPAGVRIAYDGLKLCL